MKHLFIILAFLCIQNAWAKNFGGIEFHSSVSGEQFSLLKKDLKYLYNHSAQNPDAEFLKLTGLASGDGPNLHNWLLNRVQYIVGESYPLQTVGVQNLSSSQAVNQNLFLVMVNIGAYYYSLGKEKKVRFNFLLDQKTIAITSPRVGIIQIGEGLFSSQLALNNDPGSAINSIFRLGNLFHEARHSDGNGKNVAFLHATCPSDHAFARHSVCDKAGNGPYAVGAKSMKHLLKNCSQCSLLEKKLLEIKILDSESRVLKPTDQNTIKAYEMAAKTYENLIKTNTTKLASAKNETERMKIQKEINEYQKHRENFLNLAQAAKIKTAPLENSDPEGHFRTISLKESDSIMKKSLNQK